MSRQPRGTEPSYMEYLQRGIDYVRDHPEQAAAAGLAGLLLFGDSDEESDYNVDFVFWDVEHGDAMFIDSPEANIVVDLGQHKNGFSPINYLSNNGVERVDWLIISHPDKDHIRDIAILDDQYDISLYSSPDEAAPYIKHKKEYTYPNDEVYQTISDKFLEFEGRRLSYQEPPIERGQLRVHEFSLSPDELGMTPAKQLSTDEKSPSLNNLSILNIFEYNGFKLSTMGDLEEKGIELLLDRADVRRALQGTDVLVAPHHGRDSSYAPRLFDYITPEIVAISDADGTEYSASQKYSHQATGKTVEHREGDSTVRNVVTTRKDGAIYLGVNSSSDYQVTIE
ncbi:competence protein ComEC [Halobiforma haloterrestris]|uniref:Competence protein ComEC n=1 Tax=Natronobacterium haloterrestre TaxID=148448 RepID=A0A1I1HJP3_NATHA|nr:MBL fold metallo-hydrolase [Halobiforma haloterrestris]SFC23975.1 competence protein ComEC [Halobiforma haloterrestris]